MNINRQNYEEYFLLYADNELKLSEKKLVEKFVEEHADLKVEFDLFLQMKLDPEDHTAFPEKSSLYKPIELQDDQFQPDAKELQLLMYLDNEMEEEERLAFEKKLKADKKLREEFDILLNTRVEPDFKVKFEDKASLYRHEEKRPSVIRMTWFRIAVAAVVFLIAGLLWTNRSVDSTDYGTPIAQGTGSIPTDKKSSDSADPKNNNTEVQKEVLAEAGSNNVETQTTTEDNNNKSLAKTENTTTVKRPGQKSDVQKKSENRLPESSARDMAIEVPDRTEMKVNIDPFENTTENSGSENSSQTGVSYTAAIDVKTNYATDALMHPVQETPDIEPMDEEKPRKGALRGIFRKANRIFNKVTNPDPNIPSVRVANLEFALAK